MRFFFDRCMPVRLARMIDVLETEHTVRHHDEDDRFNQSTTDIEWLSALAKDPDPWIIVSGDGRILKNKAEAEMLRSTGFTFFCLSKQWPHMGIYEYAWKFIRIWPEIVRNADPSGHKLFQVSGGAALKIERIR